MPLKILTNTVWNDAVQIVATDTSNVTTGEDATIENVTGGSPHVFWQSSATSDRRLVYINKSGNLNSSHFVLVRADRHVGHQINLYKFATYSSSATLVTSTANPLATGDLIGQSSQDLVLTCSAASQQALCAEFLAGTGGNYTKQVHQAYFCNAFTLNYPAEMTTQTLSFPSRQSYKGKSWLVDRAITINAHQLTRTDINTFEALYNLKSEPFFIYDSDGYQIRFKLLHCVYASHQVTASFDDFFDLTLNVYQLRRWA